MKFIKENVLIKNDFDLYNKIIIHNNIFIDMPWIQKLYNYYYNIIEIPKCSVCNKNVKFYRFSVGYRKFCSNSCHLKSTETKEKRNKTKLINHGNINYNNRDKFKETNLIKYGETSPMKNINVLNKAIETNIIRYGNKTPLLNDEVKNKINETKILKYNNVNYNNREKAKETIYKNYGVEHQMYVNDIKNKIKKTNLIKYGFENVFQNKEIIETIKNVNSLTFKKKWSNILNIPISNIKVCDDVVTISGLCCNHNEFDITKSLLYDRYRYNVEYCPKCNVVNSHDSDAENKLRNFIETELKIITEKINIENKEIDIYISSHKLGIEFNGLYWHSELFKDKNYHLNKTELCEQRDIQLLHIFEDEWIYKKEIVKSIIRSKLGLIEYKIYARKCYIKEIDSITSSNFLNENHIQGNVNSKIKLGLFYGDELVSVMTFENTRKSIENNNINSFTLNRFCTKLNTQVIGGASKLLKYFIKTYKPKSIISFADKRYSQGNLYEKLGFIMIKHNQPTYTYFKNNELIRYHRFNFRKEILNKNGFNTCKTEREIMKERGYLRIFDSGNIKYLMKF